MAVTYQVELRRRVREAMAAKRWTDKQLAQALRHPHRQTVQRWLSEDPEQHRAISVDNLTKIAKALGVTVKALDPDGTEAYDPSNRPLHMRRGSTTRVRGVSYTRHMDPAMPEGVDVTESFPDLALFRKLRALWEAMEPEERIELYATATRFINPPAAPHVGKARG